MTVLHYDADDKVTKFPEASEWEAGVAQREGTNLLGFGFYLWDELGNPIASCVMTPEQALAQGRYLVENATRMLEVLNSLPKVKLVPHDD